MTVQHCAQQMLDRLTPIHGNTEAKAMAKMVLEHLGLPWAPHLASSQPVVSAAQANTVESTLKQLETGMPLQYALGCAWFLNRPYRVNQHVLIPRPETEELVDWITKTLKADEALEMLDVGTGSGCIGISLALHFANAGVTALDVSSDALTVARKNALALGAANIGFLKLDFSQPSARKQLPPCDVLVSNPPYIPWAEKPGMEKLVTDWEPEVALFVPHQNPLFFYELLAAFAQSHLKKNGQIFVECHQDFATAAAAIFEQAAYTVTLKNDINNNPRMIRAQKKD